MNLTIYCQNATKERKMAVKNRVTILVMDSVGIGAQPDAEEYDSINASTFQHAADSDTAFSLPVLTDLGIGNIQGVIGVTASTRPRASFGRMKEISCGCDTFIGVWEMAGVVFNKRFVSYNPELPINLLKQLWNKIGCQTLCNQYMSGIIALDLYAERHFASRLPIVYTCDDGVILIAAHENVITPGELHQIAERMSEFFTNHGVSRIIARTFIGNKGSFERTNNRRDFVIGIPTDSHHLFSNLRKNGVEFVATQHLATIFGEQTVDRIIPGIKDSAGIMKSACQWISEKKSGVAMFVVPDFDMSGHRKEPMAYANDLMAFDQKLGELLSLTDGDDYVFITADHGCDPTLPIRGHTREYVPLLVYNGKRKIGNSLQTRQTFADLGQTVLDIMDTPPMPLGLSFAQWL